MHLPTEHIHSFWDDLVSFSFSECDESLNHALREISNMIDAQQAYWAGAVRVSDKHKGDPLFG